MQQYIFIIIAMVVGVGIGAGGAYLFFRNRFDQTRVVSDHLKEATEHLLNLAKEKLGSEKSEIKTDLDNKKDMIKNIVEELRKEVGEANRKLAESDEKRISAFSELKKEVENYGRVALDLRGSTEELKRVLSNNQLRGQFGERVAEDLLKMAGFVINQDYVFNKTNDTNASRPDYTVYLPDKTKINIDVKFPYQSLQKALSTEDKEEQKKLISQFSSDVKTKVKQVAGRDYINPEEQTVDFAMLFIPNEMIFSFIYEKLPEVWEEALAKKVVLAGPFSFTAMLRLIKQTHSNFKFQQNIHQIVGLIQKFKKEYDSFSESLDTLGSRIESASKQFQVVSTTRTRQLGRVIDQIDNQQLPDKLLDQ